MTVENTLQKDIDILDLINSRIGSYLENALFIGKLINDLENYLKQLTTINSDWKIDFRTIWLDIETAYALTLDEELEELTDSRYALVKEAVETLRKMTENKLKELKTFKN
ncbi:MAG: hypothetical protein JSR76_01505 [Verrucomicrobia bacterium]|nr:hypothetical protein [Verrucomicrobiota bacterium]